VISASAWFIPVQDEFGDIASIGLAKKSSLLEDSMYRWCTSKRFSKARNVKERSRR